MPRFINRNTVIPIAPCQCVANGIPLERMGSYDQSFGQAEPSYITAEETRTTERNILRDKIQFSQQTSLYPIYEEEESV